MNREEKIIAYILGEMTTAERVVFDRAIEEDSLLKEEFNAYKEAITALGSIENELPSASLNDHFDAYLKNEISAARKNLKTRVRQLQPLMWMGIAASILVAGFFINHSMQNNKLMDESTGINQAWIQTVSTGRTSQKIQAINDVLSGQELDTEVITAIKHVVYNDPSSNVRLAAVESLSHYLHQQEVKDVLIEALSKIEKPIVKIEIINVLTQNKEEKAKDTFEKMLTKDDLNETVRKELHSNIRKLETII